jgi:hypothetical protein
MKCERCGCPISALGGGKHTKNECILALQDERDALKAKVAEKSEPTKPERFERLRTLIGNSDAYIGSYTRIYLIDEVKDLLAAFDEAKVLISNYIYPEFIKWCDKWN